MAGERFGIRLRFATVRTRDLAGSRRFYEEALGLAVTRAEPEQYVQLDAGGAELCLDLPHEGEAQPFLIFSTDDLDGLRAHLLALGVGVVEESESYILVRDPDGGAVVVERE